MGHKVAVGAQNGEQHLIGCVILGRPVARPLDYRKIIEVTRLVTDGTPHACSFLYGAAARLAKAMGYEHIQTYILEAEPGTSLKASGWSFEAMTDGGSWNHGWRKGRCDDQPQCCKQRWGKSL